MTNTQKVLALILENPDGLDDDEISEKTGITPRQQIYQICDRLATSGQIKRGPVEKTGKRKKIHNFPMSADHEFNQPAKGRLWEQRLSALVAATGRSEDDLLDEALRNLAFRVLEEQGDV